VNLADAKALLPEMRQTLEAVGSEWVESYDTSSGHMQICERDAFDGKVYPLATLDKDIPTEQRELLRKAPLYIRAALLLRDEAVRAYRDLTGPAKEPEKKEAPNYAAEVSIKCANDAAFRRWLMEATGLHDAGDAERIKTHVRFLLKVDSLKKLNEDPEAAARWTKMRGDFKAWLRSGR